MQAEQLEFDQGNPDVIEDKIKLRELELQAQYELKYLSDNLADLKTFVKENKETDAAKISILEKKINWIAYLVLAQLAGADIPALAKLVSQVLM